MRGELARRRAGGALARALERVEFVVANAGGFVGKGHQEVASDEWRVTRNTEMG